jgi:TPP-dependent indolepyruvate ferredoxin oxidoreductase alpha subunit
VLVIAGDDHAAKSSTLPHQTEHVLQGAMMPVLAPAGVQEYLDYGLHGWAMSRYSGCWVAFKALADTVETSASVDVDPLRRIVCPTISRCRPAASTSAGPTRRCCRKPACSTTSSMPRWPTAAPTSSTAS